VFRGGLLWWALEIDAVTATGASASRLRLLTRSLVAWTPVFLAPIGIAVLTAAGDPALAILIPTLGAAGFTAISLMLPDRGLADRCCGVWLMPR